MTITDPTSFERSLEEAERACFDALVTVLGLTAGKNAYIGLSDGNPDCMVFDIGYIQTGDMTAFKGTVFHFRASADFYSRNRQNLQRFLMRTVSVLPISPDNPDAQERLNGGNVVHFRIAPETQAVSDITTTTVKMGKDGKETPTFTATVSFDVVFVTGAREE